MVALNSSTVQVSWDPPPQDKQNGPVNGYVLSIFGVNSHEEFEIDTDQSSNITLFSLHPFYTYSYTIAAVGIGIGPYSSAVLFQMPEEGRFIQEFLCLAYISFYLLNSYSLQG